MLIGYFTEYRGFVGTIEYDKIECIHRGSLVGFDYLITYQGVTLLDLNYVYKATVDHLIEAIKSHGFERTANDKL